MKRYSVTIHELVSYSYNVEAEDEDEAAEQAEARFLEDPNPHPDAVLERDVANVEELKEDNE